MNEACINFFNLDIYRETRGILSNTMNSFILLAFAVLAVVVTGSYIRTKRNSLDDEYPFLTADYPNENTWTLPSDAGPCSEFLAAVRLNDGVARRAALKAMTGYHAGHTILLPDTSAPGARQNAQKVLDLFKVTSATVVGEGRVQFKTNGTISRYPF